MRRRGVQIVDLGRIGRLWVVGMASRLGGVERNGRHLRAGVASRFLVVADLDASWVLAWRPDLGYMAEWTPLTGWGGVQIGDVWWNGRHLRVGAASRFGLYGGLDASYGLARRPDWESRADWTPVTGLGGVQIVDLGQIGRHLRAGAASRLWI